MAIGRITGQMLSATLSRGTTDLTIATTGDSNLLFVDATNDRIGIGLNNPGVQFQTSGDVTIGGNLTVNGTTNTINSTTVTVDDKNIELGSTASPSDASADGGGITLKGDSDKTINWVNSTGYWTSNVGWDTTAGNAYHIGGTQVLDANNLDLESININGNVISSNSNADISIQPAGTGVLKLSGLSIDSDVITSDDSSAITIGEALIVQGDFKFDGGSAVNTILDEDNMASDSATALATQQSIKAYVDSEVSGISTTSISTGNTSATVSDSGSDGTLTVTADGNVEMTVTDAGMQLGGSGARVNTILDEDDLSTNSDTALATQQSIKAYVDAQVAASNTLTIGDESSTEITLDLDDVLNVQGGNSLTATVSGDTLSFALDDNITVDQIGAKDSSSINITSPIQVTGNINTDTSLTIAGSTVVDGIVDEDNMASNSATKLATQQSIKAYVDTQDAAIASDTLTFTNKTFDANGSGNSLSNVEVADFAASAIVTESEGIGSNDNDTTIPTSAAVKAYADSVSGGTLSLGDDASNAGSVATSSAEDLVFHSGNSITMTVAGNGVTAALNDEIVVNAISSSDSSFVRINDSLETEAAQINTTLTVDGNATIKGNLSVEGTTTYISTDNTKITDSILLLNNGNSGGSDIDSGIMVERGSAGNNAVFYWNEGDDRFKAVLSTSDEAGTTIADSSYATVNLGGLVFAAESVVADSILDEDAMGSNSATALATQQSIKAYVDAQDANIASDTLTLTNKTFDANGTGNSLSNVEVADFAASAVVTESEGITSSDNDTSFPTTAAVRDYVDAQAGGTLTLGDDASNAGSVNSKGDEDLVFHSGDSITATVAGNGVTFDLNETISVDTITAGDSSAITVGSPIISTSSIKFNGSVAVSSILDEDAMGSNSASALATQQSIKAYVDAQDANIASDTLTLTNKTFDANGTGNSISNIEVADLAASAVVLESEGIGSNDNDTTIPTSAAVKDYVDTQVSSSTVADINDISNVDATGVLDGDILVVNDDSSNVFTNSSNLSTAMRLPAGNTAARPTAYAGLLRFNSQTGKYEGSTDGSTFSAFAMEDDVSTLVKDVFSGNGGASYNFSNVTDPTAVASGSSNGALGLLVYIDNVIQEPTQNYTVSPTAITFDSVVHSGARIVVIQGFDA